MWDTKGRGVIEKGAAAACRGTTLLPVGKQLTRRSLKNVL